MKTNKLDVSIHSLNNLPPRPIPFINRAEEIDKAISALLDSKASIIALTGIAGIGKTTLALEIAYRLLDKGKFEGGIIWLPIRTLHSFDDFIFKIGKVSGKAALEVNSWLSSPQCLIVLDGLDELNLYCEPDMERFFKTFPVPGKVLVTSRYEFKFPLETITIQVDSFSEHAAIELFKALSAPQDKNVTYANHQAISEIIEPLGYHPLALTLAAHFIQGNYTQARKGFQQVLDLLEELKNDRQRAAILHILGSISQAQSNYSEALQFYQQSLTIEDRLDDSQGKSATLQNLAQIFIARGDVDHAIQLYEEALAIREKLGDEYGMAQTYNNLGLVYSDKGDWDKAIKLYQNALDIMEKVGDTLSIGQTYNNLGVVYYDKGQWNKATEFYQKSLEMMERLGNVQGKAAALHNMGQVFLSRGEFNRAMQLYQESLRLKESAGDLKGVASELVGIGQVQSHSNSQIALEHYQRALIIYEQIGDCYGSAIVSYNLSLLYRDQGNFKKALETLAQSQVGFTSLGLSHQVDSVKSIRADVEYELGKQYVEQSRWYDALHLFEKSLAIRRQNHDLNARANTIYQIAYTHHLIGNLDNARIHYRDALRLYEHVGNDQGIAACKTGLGRLMIQMGFVDDALRELASSRQIYRNLGDSKLISEVEKVLQVANHIKEKQPA